MIRVADYIAQTLADHGIKHVFLVTGGGAMHLNDAFGRCRDLELVCCHHEQACSMAAESYTRLTGKLAAVNVTTGPGATNAITGVYGAYVDSIGMMVISGQSKMETLVRSTNLPLRQLGDQEVDIVPMVKGITKYSVMITDARTVRYHLEKALHLSMSGRPGPCWIDVPINIQATKINPEELPGYDQTEDSIVFESPDLDFEVATVFEKLKTAKRPVIYAGWGLRAAGVYDQFIELADLLQIPAVPSWNNNDLLWDDHPAYAGRPGSVGTRAGNFTVQNADFLLILGCRLNIRLISYNWENFAPHAFKAMVDVDVAELKKPTLKIDQPIHADLKNFIPKLLELARSWKPAHEAWRKWCRERVQKYPVVLPEYWQKESPVNPYCFIETLFKFLNTDDVIVTGDGTACVTAFQAGRVLPGMRLYHNSGCASMGYDLPAAIGAAIGTKPGQRVICIAGDGSIMMNLQELQTISGKKLNVKVFVLNNSGYHSIRQTQRNFFPDNVVGCGTDSGLSFPDFGKIAAAFEMPFARASGHGEMENAIQKVLNADGPALGEIVLDLEQQFSPKLSSRKLDDGRMVTSPPEDMAPFLSREELQENMLVPAEKTT